MYSVTSGPRRSRASACVWFLTVASVFCVLCPGDGSVVVVWPSSVWCSVHSDAAHDLSRCCVHTVSCARDAQHFVRTGHRVGSVDSLWVCPAHDSARIAAGIGALAFSISSSNSRGSNGYYRTQFWYRGVSRTTHTHTLGEHTVWIGSGSCAAGSGSGSGSDSRYGVW